MLEYWFKEKRTLVDFRRGLLGLVNDNYSSPLMTIKIPHSASLGTNLQVRDWHPSGGAEVWPRQRPDRSGTGGVHGAGITEVDPFLTRALIYFGKRERRFLAALPLRLLVTSFLAPQAL